MKLRKHNPIFSILNSSLVDLPAPNNISHMWNFGSLLGICLLSQTISGIFLAMHYSSSTLLAFECIDHIMRDVSSGWIVRLLHANGASLFFIAIYLHMSRNIYYQTFQSSMAWSSGVFIFLISMLTAFLGYVLPWGQMSYWGATVITNLLSAIPYMGKLMVEWVWGGFSVDNATLSRFFALHYLLPFILFVLVIIHLVFIHENKSSNPLGVESYFDKIPFHPYFSTKDMLSLTLIFFFFMLINMSAPFMLMDPDNFTPANPLVTPTHIQPEWYFLFAYAILRAIPNKLGGVLALMMSIMIFLILPLENLKTQYQKTSKKLYFFWLFLMVFLFLTLLGTKPVEEPFISMSVFFTSFYFMWFFI